MSAITLHEGDNRDTLRRLIDQGVRVHSVVTDPPYGLVSVTKRFGKEGAAPAKFGTDGVFARASGGFMGSQWDATGIERDPEFWRLVWEILLPGGYCFAFSSPRTGHWQACAMEVAGFVMHPFLGWVYGQGFPKDSDAQRAIDTTVCQEPGRHYESVLPRDPKPGDHVCGKSSEGQAWEGYSYGAQAMKPALEPIYVGQKPFSERNGALNLLKHGAGAINVDGCRVHAGDAQGGEYTVKRLRPGADLNREGGNWRAEDETALFQGSLKPGRHPANLIHDGSENVVALFPQAKSGSSVRGTEPSSPTDAIYNQFAGRKAFVSHDDDGSAARFFNAFPMTDADIDRLLEAGLVVDVDADVIRYQGKATKADRAGSKHPTVKPIALIQWLVRLGTPPGGTVLDPFAGSGTTGEAARREGFDCVLMEAQPQFAKDIRTRLSLHGEVSAFETLFNSEEVQEELMSMFG